MRVVTAIVSVAWGCSIEALSTIELGCVVRFPMRPLIMVAAALLVIVVIGVLVLGMRPTSHPGSTVALAPLTSTLTPSAAPGTLSSSYYEGVGGCAEDAHDHNHDLDPQGFVDQEDDECLPAQHAPRLPDGAPAN